MRSIERLDSDDDAFVKAVFDEERAAIRELFQAPAAESEAVWAKFSAFEINLVKDLVVGEAGDCTLLLGLGSIQADLMNLGIGREDF